MMNALNSLFHSSTLPLYCSLTVPLILFKQTSQLFTRFTDFFSQYPNANLLAAFLGRPQNWFFASCLLQFPVNRPPAKPRCPLRCHFLPTSLRNQLVTMPVSQIIADWKQQNATDAVQKIARFAAMFGSVTHSHQPHVT